MAESATRAAALFRVGLAVAFVGAILRLTGIDGQPSGGEKPLTSRSRCAIARTPRRTPTGVTVSVTRATARSSVRTTRATLGPVVRLHGPGSPATPYARRAAVTSGATSSRRPYTPEFPGMNATDIGAPIPRERLLRVGRHAGPPCPDGQDWDDADEHEQHRARVSASSPRRAPRTPRGSMRAERLRGRGECVSLAVFACPVGTDGADDRTRTAWSTTGSAWPRRPSQCAEDEAPRRGQHGPAARALPKTGRSTGPLTASRPRLDPDRRRCAVWLSRSRRPSSADQTSLSGGRCARAGGDPGAVSRLRPSRRAGAGGR